MLLISTMPRTSYIVHLLCSIWLALTSNSTYLCVTHALSHTTHLLPQAEQQQCQRSGGGRGGCGRRGSRQAAPCFAITQGKEQGGVC